MSTPSAPPLRLTLASTNPHKHQEIQAFLLAHRLPVELALSPDVGNPEESGHTFLENAKIKALAAQPAPESFLILAEDAGFVIPTLAGTHGLDPFPGVRSKRWLSGTDSDRNQGILSLMANHPQREAAYHSAMVLLNPGGQVVFETEATMPLRLIDTATVPRGNGGFGYDPIVHPLMDGTPALQTVAELSMAEKNRLSHRGKALAAIAAFLGSDRAPQ
jgi:XTP/dITP diphosphohydrolase